MSHIEVKIIPTLKVKVNHPQKTIGTLTKVFYHAVNTTAWKAVWVFVSVGL